MGQVLIRNLDDALLADYRQAAKANARSLEAELREALARGRPLKPRLSATELTALSQRLWAMTPDTAAMVDSTPLIREMRDEGYGSSR
ncbi:MAG: FitA-like ribbon-helix-helix domain-containing protein [Sphingomonas sp.]